MMSRCLLLLSIPTPLLCWCLSPLLTDSDAGAFATCSRETLRAMERYTIKRTLWWVTEEIFQQQRFRFIRSAGACATSTYLFGCLRRAHLAGALDDAALMTSLIASLPTSVQELEVCSDRVTPALCLIDPISFPPQLTSLLLETVKLPDNGALLYLPSNLRILSLPWCPGRPRWQDIITALPESLHTLRLSMFPRLRSLQTFIFPPHLTELDMGDWRGPGQELPSLPTGLRTLVLPRFRLGVGDLARQLPMSLTEISFGCEIDESIDGFQWPPSIQVMRFSSFMQPLLDWRPPLALETLHLGWGLSLPDLRLPATLQRLTFGTNSFQGTIDAAYCWPSHLRTLHLGDAFRLPLSDVKWPAALEELQLSFRWDCPCHQLRLPPRLLKLRFGGCFNQSIAELKLPSSLRWLGFGDAFNQPVEGVLHLPPQLQQLHFGSGNNYDKFTQSLADMHLPSTLQSLYLPMSLQLQVEQFPRLPVSLRVLYRFQSDDANVESAWETAVAALPRCEMILRPERSTNPSPQQRAFERFS